MKEQSITIEGNNGGDYITIFNDQRLEDNMVHLTVGHCCVVQIDMVIPVEILTAILIQHLDQQELTTPDMLPWNTTFNNKLIVQTEKANVSTN